MKPPLLWRNIVALSLLLLLGTGLKGQDPLFYWNCDVAGTGYAADVHPNMGFFNMSAALPGDCPPIGQPGGVRNNYLALPDNGTLYRVNLSNPTEFATFYGDQDPGIVGENDVRAFTFEGWFRFQDLHSKFLFQFGSRAWFLIDDEKISVSAFTPPVATCDPGVPCPGPCPLVIQNTYAISLDGPGLLDPCTYLRGEWHHFALRYNYWEPGVQFSVFVDGVHLPFDVPNAGHLADPLRQTREYNRVCFPPNGEIGVGSNSAPCATTCGSLDCRMDVDEIAFFNVALCPEVINRHFNNVTAGLPYDFSPPPGGAVCGPCAACVYTPPPLHLNPLDYPVGYWATRSPVFTPIPCPDCDRCSPPPPPPFDPYPPCSTCLRYPAAPAPLQGFYCADDHIADPSDYCMPLFPPPSTDFVAMLGTATPPLLDQLNDFPLPRFAPGANLPLNMPFLGFAQLGMDQPLPTPAAAAEVMVELTNHHNYAFQITNGFAHPVPDAIEDELLTRWGGITPRPVTAALINWEGAVHPGDGDGSPYITRHNLEMHALMPSGTNYYYRTCSTSSTSCGNPWLIAGRHCASPDPAAEMAPTCDMEKNQISLASRQHIFHRRDGESIDNILDDYESRYGVPIDFVIENGEVIKYITNLNPTAYLCLTRYEFGPAFPPNVSHNPLENCSGLNPYLDVNLSEDFRAFNLGAPFSFTVPLLTSPWMNYQATRFQEMRDVYKTALKGAGPGRNLIWYNVSDVNRSFWLYSRSRLTNDLIGSRRYPTPYFYAGGAGAWVRTSGARNGFETIELACEEHKLGGDHYFAPYVSPGYSDGSSTNIIDRDIMRPGPYLGVLKGLSLLGAEFFNVFQYNESKCPTYNHNRWHGWQLVTPGLVQGVTSRYEGLYNNSTVMAGDYTATTGPWAGIRRFGVSCINSFVYVRQGTGTFTNQFVIGGFIGSNESSEMPTAMELIEDEMEEEIHLGGQAIQFDLRKQGSIYILNNTNPAAPVFYQVDGWHERDHYSYWTPDFRFEAELFDGNELPGFPGIRPFEIATINEAGPGVHERITDYDFRDFTSYVTCQAGLPSTCWESPDDMPWLAYSFEPRRGEFAGAGTGIQRRYDVWVRARAIGGQSGFFPCWDPGAGMVDFPGVCVSGETFRWYKVDVLSPTGYGANVDQVHRVILKAWSANLEIDQVYVDDLSEDPFTPAPADLAVDCPFPFELPDPLCTGGMLELDRTGWTECVELTIDFGYAAPGDAAIVTFPIGVDPITHSYAGAPPGAYPISITYTRDGDLFATAGGVVNIGLLTAGINTTAPVAGFVCHGTEITLTATPTSSVYSYVWAGAGLTPCAGGDFCRTLTGNSALGTQAYSVTVSYGAGCTDDFTFNLTHVANPNPVAAGPPGGYCSGAAFPLTVTGVTAPFGAVWTQPVSGYVCASPPACSATVVSGPSTFHVVVTDANGCIGEDDVTIAPSYTVTVDATPPGPVCTGTPVTLSATTPCTTCVYTYTWILPDGSIEHTPTVDVAIPGTVTVTLDDGLCASTTTYIVPVAAPSMVVLSGAVDLCNGEDLMVIAAPGSAGYIWEDNLVDVTAFATTAGGLSTLVLPAAILTPGTHVISVSGVDALGCPIAPLNHTVTVHDPSDLAFSASPIFLCDSETELVTVGPVPGTGDIPTSYVWSHTTSTSGTQAFVGINATFTTTVTAMAVYGTCLNPTTVTLTIHNRGTPDATINIVGGVLCPGGLATLEVDASPGFKPFFSYLWSTGATTPTITSVPSGTYSVTVTSAVAPHCPAVATETVSEIAAPTFSLVPGPIDLCPGGIGYIDVLPDPVVGAIGYIFNPGSGGSAVPEPFEVTGGAVTSLTSTVYEVYAVYGAGVCTTAVPQVIEVREHPAPEAEITPPGPIHVCGVFTSMVLDATATSPGSYTYDWSPTTIFGSSPTITAYLPGTYSVTVTSDDYPNCSVTDAVTITNSPNPTVSITGPGFVCPGQSAILTAAASGGTPPYTYAWSGGGTGPTKEVFASGTWAVTATDANGCTGHFNFILNTTANCCTLSCVTVPLAPNLSLGNNFSTFPCSTLVTATNTELPVICTPAALNSTGATTGRITVANNSNIGIYVPTTATQDHSLLASPATPAFIAGYLNDHGAFDAYYHNVSVSSGTKYVFTAWVNNPKSGPGTKDPTFTLQVIQGGVTHTLASSGLVSGGPSWRQICGSYTATGTGTAVFIVTAEKKHAFFAIDDIVIQQATSAPCKTEDFTPAAPAPLTIGENQLRVFPNPSDAIFFLSGTLDSESSVNLSLTADNGVVLSSEDYLRSEGDFEIPIDLTNVTKGVYHLRVTIGGEQWYFKLVKQ